MLVNDSICNEAETFSCNYMPSFDIAEISTSVFRCTHLFSCQHNLAHDSSTSTCSAYHTSTFVNFANFIKELCAIKHCRKPVLIATTEENRCHTIQHGKSTFTIDRLFINRNVFTFFNSNTFEFIDLIRSCVMYIATSIWYHQYFTSITTKSNELSHETIRTRTSTNDEQVTFTIDSY